MVFHKIQQKWGPLEVDMFASRLTTQLHKEVLQMEPRSRSRSSGCFQPGLEQPTGERLCQSSLESCWQSAKQSAATTDHTSSSGTSMEGPTMVPHTIGHVGELPSPPSSQEGPDHSNTPRECASNGPPTSRMALLRQRFQGQEILESGLTGVINDTLSLKSPDSVH